MRTLQFLIRATIGTVPTQQITNYSVYLMNGLEIWEGRGERHQNHCHGIAGTRFYCYEVSNRLKRILESANMSCVLKYYDQEKQCLPRYSKEDYLLLLRSKFLPSFTYPERNKSFTRIVLVDAAQLELFGRES